MALELPLLMVVASKFFFDAATSDSLNGGRL
jgi:hypothetical protein